MDWCDVNVVSDNSYTGGRWAEAKSGIRDQHGEKWRC